MEIFPRVAVGFRWNDQDASRARIFSWPASRIYIFGHHFGHFYLQQIYHSHHVLIEFSLFLLDRKYNAQNISYHNHLESARALMISGWLWPLHQPRTSLIYLLWCGTMWLIKQFFHKSIYLGKETPRLQINFPIPDNWDKCGFESSILWCPRNS